MTLRKQTGLSINRHLLGLILTPVDTGFYSGLATLASISLGEILHKNRNIYRRSSSTIVVVFVAIALCSQLQHHTFQVLWSSQIARPLVLFAEKQLPKDGKSAIQACCITGVSYNRTTLDLAVIQTWPVLSPSKDLNYTHIQYM